MEDLEIKLKLSNQSFVEAGGKDVYPDLEIVGVVHAILTQGENCPPWNFRRINKRLDICAEEMFGTHVFGIKYLLRPDGSVGEVFYGAIGTVYKTTN